MLCTAPSAGAPAVALSKNLKKAPGGQDGAVGLATLASKSTPAGTCSPGSRDLKGSLSPGCRPQSPHPRGPGPRRSPSPEPSTTHPYFGGPHPSPHRGAGPPEQESNQVAVLAQQVERGVHGVAPLALEGDEDGSARELQQPAQALPAGAGPSGGRGRGPTHPGAGPTGSCGCTRPGPGRLPTAPR